jgi:AraC-like DNA-binding protein
LEVIQTGHGHFRAALAAFTSGQCDVQLGSINRAILAHGGIHRGRLGFLLELRQARDWSCFGQAVSDSSVAVYAGGCELVLKAGPGTEWAFVSVAPAALERCAAVTHGRDLSIPKRGFEVIRVNPAELAIIRALLAETQATIAAGFPGRGRSRSSLDRALCRSMTRILMVGEVSEVSRGQIVAFRDAVRKVDVFLAPNREGPIQMDELCAATGLDRPNLEKLFHDYLGVGPLRYLEIRRLYQVYKALLRANPSTTTVADLARAWGFWRTNRFSANFSALFGKSPRKVLHQPSTLNRRLT